MGNERDERDHRMVTLYDDAALNLMPGWWGSQEDPLYAIHSMGGQHEAWVFQVAIDNLDSDIRRVKKIGRDKYRLGSGTFTKSEIDELHTIRDGLQSALDDASIEESAEDAYRYQRPSRGPGRHVMDFATLPDLLQHEQDQNGATHVLVSSSNVWVYYPGQGDKCTVGQAWQERGYWHASAPSARVDGRLRPDAMPIDQILSDSQSGHVNEAGHAVQEYFAVDHTGRVIAGPFTSYSEAKSAADRVRGYVKFKMETPAVTAHAAGPDDGRRMLPPAPLPSDSGRARPTRAPFPHRRSGGVRGRAR